MIMSMEDRELWRRIMERTGSWRTKTKKPIVEEPVLPGCSPCVASMAWESLPRVAKVQVAEAVRDAVVVAMRAGAGQPGFRYSIDEIIDAVGESLAVKAIEASMNPNNDVPGYPH